MYVAVYNCGMVEKIVYSLPKLHIKGVTINA